MYFSSTFMLTFDNITKIAIRLFLYFIDILKFPIIYGFLIYLDLIMIISFENICNGLFDLFFNVSSHFHCLIRVFYDIRK